MLRTIDPALDLADHTIRALLTALDDKPIRYEDPNGAITNTTACRGLVAWYVLIEHAADAEADAVLVAPIRLGLGTSTRGFTTRQYLKAATRVPLPSSAPGTGEAFAAFLDVYIGFALDAIEDARDEAR